MLLSGYTKEVFRPRCNAQAESLHCYAHLDQDISAVIPYLNAELGGDACSQDPPWVTFKAHGKLITVHPKKIAINALADEDEAEMICQWLQGQINDIWNRHEQIEPKHAVAAQPGIFAMLKRLPTGTACSGECGQPTCMVLAKLISEGAKSPEACPHMDRGNLEELLDYLAGFEGDLQT